MRTNLATRPFYNVRAVQAAFAVAALVVAIITAFNVVQLVRLTGSQRTLGAKAQAAEAEAQRLRLEAQQIRTRIDPDELEVVAVAAREANAIIDQRTFSWTNLMAHLEATLPADVRITEITPRPSDRLVVIGAESRSVEDLEEFILGLEETGAFRDVLATNEITMEGGSIAAVIEARYTQPIETPPGTATP